MSQRTVFFQEAIQKSLDVKQKILHDTNLLTTLDTICNEIIQTFRRDNKVLLCGNGGSAADAQHIAAELSGRFYFDREPLFAEALHVNSSYMTAVANDYSYAEVFARLVKGMGRKGDILIGISTSGNSANIVKALEVANTCGLITIGLTGQGGGKMKNIVRYLLDIPSTDTPRIQEGHILIGHILCEFVEKELFQQKK